MVFSVFEQFQFYYGLYDISLLYSFLIDLWQYIDHLRCYGFGLTRNWNLIVYWDVYLSYLLWCYETLEFWKILLHINNMLMNLEDSSFRNELLKYIIIHFAVNIEMIDYFSEGLNVDHNYYLYCYDVDFFDSDEIRTYFPVRKVLLYSCVNFLLYPVWLASFASNWLFFFIFALLVFCIVYLYKPILYIGKKQFVYVFFFELFRRVYIFFYDLAESYLEEDARSFFPYIFFIFLFISILNLIGLLPYSLALTSHLIVTFSISLISWGSFVLHGIEKHGLKFFLLFYPHGLSFYLIPFICLIEIVSHFIRLISLALRLFANIVAGHILLDLISMFLYLMTLSKFSLFKFLLFPVGFCIIIVLFFFEFAICVLQGYIFAILCCIYCRDYLYGSH